MPRSAIRPLLGLLLMLSLVGAEVAQAAPERVRVVVGVEAGRARAAERLVRRLGGDVGRRLPIVDGFTAQVPVSSIARLRRSGSVPTVAREVARDAIADAAEDAAAGSSLAPDPVASGEDSVGALQDAVADPLVPVEPT